MTAAILPPHRRMLLCVGPGGTGKTTVSAALGLAAARAGRRVIVATIDPSRRLAQALDLDREAPPGEIVPVLQRGPGRLDGLLLDTRSVFEHLVRADARDPATAAATLANPIYRATAEQLTGSVVYAALARLHPLAVGSEYDLLVIDTPSPDQALAFLDAPARIRELLDNPFARLLAGSGRGGWGVLGLGRDVLIGTLESMSGGGFLGQLGAFLRDFGGVLREIRRRAEGIEQLLHTDAAGAVLTTDPSTHGVQVSEALARELQARRVQVDGIVCNRTLGEPPADPGSAQVARAIAGAIGDAETAAVADELSRLYARARQQSEQAERLWTDLKRRHPDLPVIPVPRTDPPPLSLDELTAVGEAILSPRR